MKRRQKSSTNKVTHFRTKCVSSHSTAVRSITDGVFGENRSVQIIHRSAVQQQMPRLRNRNKIMRKNSVRSNADHCSVGGKVNHVDRRNIQGTWIHSTAELQQITIDSNDTAAIVMHAVCLNRMMCCGSEAYASNEKILSNVSLFPLNLPKVCSMLKGEKAKVHRKLCFPPRRIIAIRLIIQ